MALGELYSPMRLQTVFSESKKYLVDNQDKVLEILEKVNGGWELWLQVEVAFLLANKTQGTAQRGAAYPNPPGGFTDFMVVPTKGLQIWAELKTQTSINDETTVVRFNQDVKKIDNLPLHFKKTNVVGAMAVTLLPNLEELKKLPKKDVNTYQYDGSNWTTSNFKINRLTFIEYVNPEQPSENAIV